MLQMTTQPSILLDSANACEAGMLLSREDLGENWITKNPQFLGHFEAAPENGLIAQK
jgi:hypothetical protein